MATFGNVTDQTVKDTFMTAGKRSEKVRYRMGRQIEEWRKL